MEPSRPTSCHELLAQLRIAVVEDERAQFFDECYRIRAALVDAGIRPVPPYQASSNSDARRLALFETFEQHAPVGSVAVSADVGVVAVALLDGRVSLLDPLHRCEDIGQFRVHAPRGNKRGVSPAASVTGVPNGTSPSTGNDNDCRAVVASTFVQGAPQVLGLAVGQEAQLWWCSEDACTHQGSLSHGAPIRALDSHASQPLLASAGGDGRTILWDIERLCAARTLKSARSSAQGNVDLTGCRFFAQSGGDKFGEYVIATSGQDGATRVWDVRAPTEMRCIERGSDGGSTDVDGAAYGARADVAATCLDCHGLSRLIAVGHSCGSIACFDMRTWKSLRVLDFGTAISDAESPSASSSRSGRCMPRSLALSSCGTRLAVGGRYGELVLFNLQHRCRASAVHHHQDAISALAWGTTDTADNTVGLSSNVNASFLVCGSLDRSWSCWTPMDEGLLPSCFPVSAAEIETNTREPSCRRSTEVPVRAS